MLDFSMMAGSSTTPDHFDFDREPEVQGAGIAALKPEFRSRRENSDRS
jgi:hypothetical protein